MAGAEGKLMAIDGISPTKCNFLNTPSEKLKHTNIMPHVVRKANIWARIRDNTFLSVKSAGGNLNPYTINNASIYHFWYVQGVWSIVNITINNFNLYSI